MTRKTITVILFVVFICSCNNDADNSKEKKAGKRERTGQTENNPRLVYLDNEENMFSLICQGWEMEDDIDALQNMTDNSAFEIPFRSFYLSADGSFIKDPRNAMDYGNWQYDDASKTITINSTIQKDKAVYKIASLAYDELVLVNVGIKSSTNLKFIASGRRFKDPAEEPYYIKNNYWRMKPAKAEADSAIHRRLKENLRFFILFYKSAIEKDDKTVSFWGLPSCFTWYGGAIYMKSREKLKDNWINCFYNKDQAMKAYAMAEELIGKKYIWPKGVSWLTQNLAVVEQMYKNMDEIK